MHCGDQRHLGLCLGYVPALAYGSCRVSDQGTTLRASDLHNARATILNPFNKLYWYNSQYSSNGSEIMLRLHMHGLKHGRDTYKYPYHALVDRSVFLSHPCDVSHGLQGQICPCRFWDSLNNWHGQMSVSNPYCSRAMSVPHPCCPCHIRITSVAYPCANSLI